MRSTGRVEVIEIDVHDNAALRAWWLVEQEAVRHGRPHAVTRTYDALAASWRTPSEYHRRIALAAVDGGRFVGVGEVGLSLQDNTHVADLQVAVLPGRRRQGIGRVLHEELARRRRAEGRTTATGELDVPEGESDSPGLGFAQALGYASVHQEDHLVLPLPVGAPAPGVPAPSAYEVVTWQGACPDDLVESYCAMRTQMEIDVPTGGVEHEPVTMTPERLRTGERRLARSYDIVVAAAQRRSDGVMAGYSLVYVPHGAGHALQDDTLVMPEHRGHHLGLALKRATLSVLQREHPGLAALHTWTAPGNHAMQQTNRRFGYHPVGRLHEVQLVDRPAAD